VVRPDAHKSLLIRIVAELKIAGFNVKETQRPGTLKPEEYKLSHLDACALLLVREETRNIELYYRPKNGGINHLLIPLPANGDEEQLTALHIAEVPHRRPPQWPNPKNHLRPRITNSQIPSQDSWTAPLPFPI
jgi:hypothetical protein